MAQLLVDGDVRGGPDFTTCPRLRTTPVVATRSAVTAFCSTSSTAMCVLRQRGFTSSRIWVTISGARPRTARRAAGTCGPHISARRSPVAGARRRSGCRRRSCVARRAPGTAYRRGCARAALGLRRHMPPSRRFSSTVSSGTVERPSGTRATPIRTTSSALRPVSPPVERADPILGLTSPASVRMSVDLPAPFAPITAVTCRAAPRGRRRQGLHGP